MYKREHRQSLRLYSAMLKKYVVYPDIFLTRAYHTLVYLNNSELP